MSTSRTVPSARNEVHAGWPCAMSAAKIAKPVFEEKMP